MGSLAVLLKTGLFSTNGGTSQRPFYEITSPLFSKITLHLAPRYYPGGTFTIATEGPDIYLQKSNLNGNPLERPWLLHDTLVKGGVLKLTMGSAPNKAWGSRVEDAPPSLSR